MEGWAPPESGVIWGKATSSPDFEALTSLEWLISSEATQASVARVDWNKLLRQDRGLAAYYQFGGLAEVDDMPADPETEFMRDLLACSDADRQDWLAGKLAELIAKELRLPDSKKHFHRGSTF